MKLVYPKLILFGIVILLGIPALAIAFSSGNFGNTDRTNAPGASNCTGCHTGVVNTNPLNFSISGIPNPYTVNSTYTATLRITQAGQSRWGFQLKVSTGKITITDPTNTQLSSNSTFISHTSTGTFAGATAGVWTFNWTAPAVFSKATVYASGLAANNNGSDGSGDNSFAIATPVPVTLSRFEAKLEK